METYQNRSGSSGVETYAIGDDYILVRFRDGWTYLYSYESTGQEEVEQMKALARSGQGLNTFISRVVRKRYADKGRQPVVQEFLHWRIGDEGEVVRLTLHRAEQGNSITGETLRELHSITVMLNARDDVKVVILEGAGEHFSTGADRTLFERMLEAPEEAFRRELHEMQLALDAFERLPFPTIARLHGFCIGGGLLLALCCDFRIASQRTVFAFPEIKLGIAPLWGAHRITREVSPLKARELVLLGERFTARTALELGLLNRVAAPDGLDEAVESLSGRLRRLPPASMRMVKRTLARSLLLPPEESQRMEIEAQTELLGSAELRAAVARYFNDLSG